MSENRRELREIKVIKSIPRSTLYEMIRGASNPRDGRLMASFFLLANRCTEGLAVGPGDVSKEMAIEILDGEINDLAGRLGRLRTEVDVGKSLGRDVSTTQKELGGLFDEYQVMSELKRRFHAPREAASAAEEIARRYPQTLVYVVKLITLKREKGVPRNIPIPIVDPLAPLFLEAVKEMEGRLFSLSRQRVWYLFRRAGVYDFYKNETQEDQDKALAQAKEAYDKALAQAKEAYDKNIPAQAWETHQKVVAQAREALDNAAARAEKEMVPKNPLRHARLSELSNYLNELQVNRFAGWRIKGTADHYLHTRWNDYVPALVKAARAAPPFMLQDI